jgi:pyridoxal phosphate enzyme (YggS family)
MLPRPQNFRSDSALAGRVQVVRAQLALALQAAGRTEDSVTIVAVSKGHAAIEVTGAAQLGFRHFGESYLQEALPKLEALAGCGFTWHFIGRLQANKTRAVAERFDWVHGLDRLRIAERLAAQRPPQAPALNVCIQVNIAHDDLKAGVAPAEAAGLLQAVAELPRLRLRGLMCMLPESLPPAARRDAFARLRALLAELRVHCPQLDTLSMGMSGDFTEAILEGATLVRIGTAIFGPR